MADNEIPINITVETAQAQKSVNDFEASLGGFVKNMESGFAKLAVAAAAAFSFMEIFNFFHESIKAAAEADQVVQKLNVSLASTGEFSKEASQEIQKYASEIQKTTTLSDDAVLSAFALAKSFGITNDEAKKLTNAAINLAAATDKDVNAAITELGGTLSGAVGRLGKLGTEFKGLTEESLKSGKAIELVQKRFDGFAEAMTNTFSGATAQAKNAFGELQEAIGKSTTQNPHVIALIKALSTALLDLAETIDGNREGLSKFRSDTIRFAIDFTGALLSVTKAALQFGADFQKIMTFIPNLVIEAARLTVKAVEPIANVLINSLSDIPKTLQTIGAEIISTVLSIAKEIPGAGLAFEKLGVDVDGLQKRFENITKLGITKLKEEIPGVGITVAALDESLNALSDTTNLAGKAFAAGALVTGKIEAKFNELIVPIKDINDGLIDTTTNLNNAAKGFKTLTEAQIKARDEFLNFIDALNGNDIDKVAAKQLEDTRKAIEARAKGLISAAELQDAFAEIDAAAEKAANKILRDAAVANPIKFTLDVIVDSKAGNFVAKQLDGILGDTLGGLVDKTFADLSASIAAHQEGIAAGLSGLSSALSGKQGAVDIISKSLGSGIADALGSPELAPLIGGIFQKLAQGPDAVKQFVREFVDAVPDIITNIAEAMPAVAEALVDSLINKGGIIRIAVALTRALAGEAILRSVGKQLGIDFADSFNAPNVGKVLAKAFVDGVGGLADVIGGIQEAGHQAGVDIKNAILAIPSDLTNFFTVIVPQSIEGAFAKITNLFTVDVPDIFDRIGSQLAEGFRGIGQEFATNLTRGITQGFEPFQQFLSQFQFQTPEWLQGLLDSIGQLFTTPGWVDKFEKTVDRLTNIGNIGTGGGIDTGGFLKKLGVPGFASGGVIPPGFPNDTFNARLTSKELVLPPDIATGLIDLIAHGDVVTQPQQDNTLLVALLGKILSAVSAPMESSATVTLNNKAFADIVLQLSRNNARLTA